MQALNFPFGVFFALEQYSQFIPRVNDWAKNDVIFLPFSWTPLFQLGHHQKLDSLERAPKMKQVHHKPLKFIYSCLISDWFNYINLQR